MTEGGKITHVAFVDESHWNIGRFRSLGAVSVRFEDHYQFEQEVSELLRESGVDELKWKKIKTAKYRLAAEKICKWVVERGVQGNLRLFLDSYWRQRGSKALSILDHYLKMSKR